MGALNNVSKTIFGTFLTLSIIGGATRFYLAEQRKEDMERIIQNQQQNYRPPKQEMRETYVKFLGIHRQVVKSFPEISNHWNNICEINLSLITEYKEGSLEEAIEACEKSLDLEPNNIKYLNTTAKVYCIGGLSDKAEEIFKKINELDKTYSTTSCPE